MKAVLSPALCAVVAQGNQRHSLFLGDRERKALGHLGYETLPFSKIRNTPEAASRH